MFPSFSIYPNILIPPSPYEEFTKNLLMKLSLQNFLINLLTMDSFNDLMAIHRKIDEMLQGIIFRQPNTNAFSMPASSLTMDQASFNVIFKKNIK